MSRKPEFQNTAPLEFGSNLVAETAKCDPYLGRNHDGEREREKERERGRVGPRSLGYGAFFITMATVVGWGRCENLSTHRRKPT
jgi:hypothetical protein